MFSTSSTSIGVIMLGLLTLLVWMIPTPLFWVVRPVLRSTGRRILLLAMKSTQLILSFLGHLGIFAIIYEIFISFLGPNDIKITFIVFFQSSELVRTLEICHYVVHSCTSSSLSR